MVRHTRHATVLCMSVGIALALCLFQQSAQASCNWQRSPIADALFSVSAIAPSDIWAAGSGMVNGTLLYHFDGANWSAVQVPLPQHPSSTTFVSATADNNVWGVSTYTDGSGNVQPYAVFFDGTQWRETLLQTELPIAPRALFLQAFASNDAWVVGSVPYGQNSQEVYASEHWNGTGWTTVQFEFPIERGQRSTAFEIDALEGVSSTDLWAVGKVTGSRPLFEHFDGASWRIAHVPSLGPNAVVIEGVHAISSTDVWGVGYSADRTGHLRTYAAHWDGHSWAYVPTPNFDWPQKELSNNLIGVAASGSHDVWAVGDVGDIKNVGLLAEHWDGNAWTIVRKPTSMGFGALIGVADLSPQDVWAVGLGGIGGSQGLADFWCAPGAFAGRP